MPPCAAPSPWVQRFAGLLRPRARVLDVAAGAGRHVRFLTALGHHVTAVDRDPAALAQAGASEAHCADLELGGLVLAQRRFDAVVVTNYLHRPLFGQISAWLDQEAVLLYETFARGQEAIGRPSNPDFLLERGELLKVFEQLHIVAFEDGLEAGSNRCVQRLCAVRRSTVQALATFATAPQ